MIFEYLIAGAGFLSVVFIFYRINIVIDQDFSDKEDIVNDPLVYAVHPDTDFEKFKANSWRGLDALWAAIRFRTFYNRFVAFISPRSANVLLIVVGILFASLIIVVGIEKADKKYYTIIGAFTGTLNVFWWAIIDYGRILKKAVDKLRL